MIVDSMTYQDIMQLHENNTHLVTRKIEEGLKFFSKDVSKNLFRREPHFYRPMEFSSPNGLNYVVQFFDGGRDYPTKERTRLVHYFWFVKNRGFYAMNVSRIHQQFKHYNIYTPHFIDRYRQRYLKDLSVSKKEVVLSFLKNNMKNAMGYFPSEKYPTCTWEFGNDGLCLCNLLNDKMVIELKTFVTFDMLGIDQKKFAVKAKECLNTIGFDLSLPDEDFDEFSFED